MKSIIGYFILVSSDKNNLLQVALQSPTLVQFSPYKIHTEEYLEEFIRNSLKELEIEFRYPFIIFDKAKNTYAGSTSFANISNKDKRAEIGWTWIGKDFQKHTSLPLRK